MIFVRSLLSWSLVVLSGFLVIPVLTCRACRSLAGDVSPWVLLLHAASCPFIDDFNSWCCSLRNNGGLSININYKVLNLSTIGFGVIKVSASSLSFSIWFWTLFLDFLFSCWVVDSSLFLPLIRCRYMWLSKLSEYSYLVCWCSLCASLYNSIRSLVTIWASSFSRPVPLPVSMGGSAGVILIPSISLLSD